MPRTGVSFVDRSPSSSESLKRLRKAGRSSSSSLESTKRLTGFVGALRIVEFGFEDLPNEENLDGFREVRMSSTELWTEVRIVILAVDKEPDGEGDRRLNQVALLEIGDMGRESRIELVSLEPRMLLFILWRPSAVDGDPRRFFRKLLSEADEPPEAVRFKGALVGCFDMLMPEPGRTTFLSKLTAAGDGPPLVNGREAEI